MTNFTKKDLKNGMYVETRKGNRYIVIDNNLLRHEGYVPLNIYNDDLKCGVSECFDIMKVFDVDNRIDFDTKDVIWERKEAITIGDIFKSTDDEILVVYKIDKDGDNNLYSTFVSYRDEDNNTNEFYITTLWDDEINKCTFIGHDTKYSDVLDALSGALNSHLE